MKRHLLLISLMALLTLAGFARSPKVIAHRGYWKTEGSAQNSIASLKKAQEIKCWGAEMDLYLTADDVVVVNHDAKTNGMTIESTPYAKLKEIKLSNGEELSTFEAYLQQGKKSKKTRLIIEIKAHSTPQLETKAVEAIVEMVKKQKLQKRSEYITFSKHMVSELRRVAPKARIAYLSGDLSPAQAKLLGATGIDYHYGVFEKHPTWIKEAHDLKMDVNVWTVNTPEMMIKMIDQQVDFITTDEPVLLQQLLNQKR